MPSNSTAADDKSKKLIASFENGDFATINPYPHPIQTSVMPVLALRENLIRPVGTCFAVSNDGLLLTAKHVLDEALGITGRNRLEFGPEFPDCWLQVMYLSDEKNDDGTNIGGLLSVNRAFFNDELDLAVLHVQIPTLKKTKQSLPMPKHTLSPGAPAIGQHCFGIGYHSMDWIPENEGYKVVQSFSASKGLIEDVYYPLRDSGRLSFPCFRTTATYDSGMSGGPIIGENGNVIGIVCDDCHGSMIGPAMLIPVIFSDKEENEKRKFLYAAIEGGSIKIDDSIDQTSITHADNELIIDFGLGPELSNVL